MATPTDEKMYICQKCPKRYKDIRTLTRHVLYHHKRDTIPIEELTCPFCQHIFIRRNDVKKHLNKAQFCSLLQNMALLNLNTELSFVTEGTTPEVTIRKSQPNY